MKREKKRKNRGEVKTYFLKSLYASILMPLGIASVVYGRKWKMERKRKETNRKRKRKTKGIIKVAL